MLVVTTSVVTDPQYLREPFIVTTHFKKQSNDAGWSPSGMHGEMVKGGNKKNDT